MADKQFHITFTPPNKAMANWPKGFWALYEITGDQIAERIVRFEGKVIERHSWCGFIGGYNSIDEVAAEIKKLVKP